MDKNTREPSRTQKKRVGISFRMHTLEKLDEFAQTYCSGDRSQAANHLLNRYFLRRTLKPDYSKMQPMHAFYPHRLPIERLRHQHSPSQIRPELPSDA